MALLEETCTSRELNEVENQVTLNEDLVENEPCICGRSTLLLKEANTVCTSQTKNSPKIDQPTGTRASPDIKRAIENLIFRLVQIKKELNCKF